MSDEIAEFLSELPPTNVLNDTDLVWIERMSPQEKSYKMTGASLKSVIQSLCQPILGYVPVNKAGDTMTGGLKFDGTQTIQSLDVTFGASYGLNIRTGNSTGAGAGSGNLLISTGNSSGPSGSITIRTGTSGLYKGEISIEQPESDGAYLFFDRDGEFFLSAGADNILLDGNPNGDLDIYARNISLSTDNANAVLAVGMNVLLQEKHLNWRNSSGTTNMRFVRSQLTGNAFSFSRLQDDGQTLNNTFLSFDFTTNSCDIEASSTLIGGALEVAGDVTLDTSLTVESFVSCNLFMGAGSVGGFSIDVSGNVFFTQSMGFSDPTYVGFTANNLDSTQEGAASGAGLGSIIYNTETNKFRGYDNTGWIDLGSGGGSAFSGAGDMAVITDGDGNLTTSSVTSTELSYLSGVSGAIQTQLNSRLKLDGTSIMTDDLLTTGIFFVGSVFADNHQISTGTTSGPASNIVITTGSSGASTPGNVTILTGQGVDGISGKIDVKNYKGVEVALNVDGSILIQDALSTQFQLFTQLSAPGVINLNGTSIKFNGTTVSLTELGYVAGVTSGIQTQFAGKLSLTGGTLSGGLAFSVNGLISTLDTSGSTSSNFLTLQTGSTVTGTPGNITIQTGTRSGSGAIGQIVIQSQGSGSIQGAYLYLLSGGTFDIKDSQHSVEIQSTSGGVLQLSATSMTAPATSFSGDVSFTGTTHAGIKLNSLTTTQRDAVSSPTSGSLIYNSTTSLLNFYSTTWVAVQSALGYTPVNIAGDTMTGLLQFSGTGHAGLKLNSLTTTQQNALTGAAGNLIYNSTTGTFNGYVAAWIALESQANKAAANGYASLDGSTKVVQNPASAQTTAAAGKIPLTGAGTTIDKAWLPVFIGSGSTHAAGAVPDPPATAGSAKFLCEDAVWRLPGAGVFVALDGSSTMTGGLNITNATSGVNLLLITGGGGSTFQVSNRGGSGKLGFNLATAGSNDLFSVDEIGNVVACGYSGNFVIGRGGQTLTVDSGLGDFVSATGKYHNSTGGVEFNSGNGGSLILNSSGQFFLTTSSGSTESGNFVIYLTDGAAFTLEGSQALPGVPAGDYNILGVMGASDDGSYAYTTQGSNITIETGAGGTSLVYGGSVSGTLSLLTADGGDGATSGGAAGDILIQCGNGGVSGAFGDSHGRGGSIYIQAGTQALEDVGDGDVSISSGRASGTGLVTITAASTLSLSSDTDSVAINADMVIAGYVASAGSIDFAPEFGPTILSLTSGAATFSAPIIVNSHNLATYSMFDGYSDAGNSGTSETQASALGFGSSKLAHDGDKIAARYIMTLVNSSSTKRARVYFANNLIYDSTALTTSSAGTVSLQVLIMRTSATTARCDVIASTNGTSAAPAVTYTLLTGLSYTDSSAVLKLTLTAASTGAATNDIVSNVAHAMLIGAA